MDKWKNIDIDASKLVKEPYQKSLTPYKVHRYFDGAQVWWYLKRGKKIVDIFEDHEEAISERNRRNTEHGLDMIL